MKPAAASLVAVSVANGSAAAVPPAGGTGVAGLVRDLRDPDERVRSVAWQRAGDYGAGAVVALVELMQDADAEIGRGAGRALRQIVHRAGRPGAAREAGQVTAELLKVLPRGPIRVRREVLWLLSEIATGRAVPRIAALLTDVDLREDARCVLQRVPGSASLRALRKALNAVPEDFKAAIADALRARGETVRDYPSQKRTPTRQTGIG